MTEVVIVTEGGGGQDDRVVKALVDAMDDLRQEGAGALERGGSIGSSLAGQEDESEQHTPILRVGR